MDNRFKFRVFYAVVVATVLLLIFLSVSTVFGFGAYPLPVQPMAQSNYTNIYGGTVKSSDSPGTNNNPVYRLGFWCWINANKCDYYALAYHDNNNYLHYLILVKPLFDNTPLYECAGFCQYRGTVSTSENTWTMINQNNYTSQNTSFSARSVINNNDGSTWYVIGNSFLEYPFTDEAIFNKIDDSIGTNTVGMSYDEFMNYIFDTYEPNIDYNTTSYDETVPTFRVLNILNTSAKSTAYDTTEALIFAANNLGKYISDSTVEVGNILSDGSTYDSSTYKLQFAFSIQSRIKNENSYMFWLDKYLGESYTYQSDILSYSNLLSHNSLTSLDLMGYLNGDGSAGYLGGLKYFLKNALGGTRGVYYYESITMYVRLLRLSDNHYGNWTIGTYTPTEDGKGGSYQVINAKPLGDNLAYIQTIQQTSSGQGAEKDFSILSEYSYTSTSSNGDVAYSTDSAYGGNSFKDFSNISDDIKQVPVIITTVFSFLPPQILSLIGICFALLVIFFILKFLQ